MPLTRKSWRFLFVPGLALTLFGYFGPWIAHRTVGLVRTGLELGEFAKFFASLQGDGRPISRVLLFAPPVASAIMLGSLATRQFTRPAIRYGALLLASLIDLTALPPYQYLLSPQYRGQLALCIGGLGLTLLTPLSRGVPRRVHSFLLALVAFAGIIPALWQFSLLYPLVASLYGTPPAIGWGLIVCTSGSVLSILAGVLDAATSNLRTSTAASVSALP